MNCCSECFSSYYLKGIINSSTTKGDCNFCGSENVVVISPRRLALFFRSIFDLYSVNAEIGNSIEIQIELDFQGKIFSSKIKGDRKLLLTEIIADDAKQYEILFNNKVALKHLNEVD